MLEAGVDPEARDSNQLTGLIWAGRKGRVEVVEELLRKGTRIDGEDIRRRTALSHAVAYQQYCFVEFICKRGANLDPVDIHGCTPLDIAISNKDQKMIALLLSFGAQSGKNATVSEAVARDAISLGVQAGDVESDSVVNPIYMSLRRLLASKCKGEYGPGFKDIGFVLRIDGKIWYWRKRGHQNLRVKQDGDVSLDIFMPEEIWKPRDDQQIKAFLAEEVRLGFHAAIERMTAKKIPFNRELLVRDFEDALAEFERM